MNSSGEQATKAGETVLVVEDEVLLRLSIAAYLRDCGYKVIEAADADEAVLVPNWTSPCCSLISRCRVRWTASASPSGPARTARVWM